jgi:hypothetical protein
MNIALGDVFSLKAAAHDLKKYDPKRPNDPNGILYWPGTQAIVVGLHDGLIDLKFPDGAVDPHDMVTLFSFFNRVEDGKVAETHVSTGYGTPPMDLLPYLPKSADWRKNYRWKVYAELEDRGFKSQMCPTPKCYNDLSEVLKNNEGLQHCHKCDNLVTSVNPKITGDLNETPQSGTVPKSG